MKKTILLLTLLFFVQNISYASFISLTTTTETAILENNSANLSLKLTNSGDEFAYSVQASLILPQYFQSEPVYIGKLGVNQSFEKNLTISLTGDVLAGKYAIPILVEYADANGYQFSSISTTSLIYSQTTSSRITAYIKELELPLSGGKKLEMYVKNLDDVDHNLKVRLFLPREVRAKDVEESFLIKGKEERTLQFDLENIAALENSNYYIFATLEYDDSLHYSSIATGFLRIIKGETALKNIPLAGDNLIIFILIAVYLIAMVAIIVYKSKKKH